MLDSWYARCIWGGVKAGRGREAQARRCCSETRVAVGMGSPPCWEAGGALVWMGSGAAMAGRQLDTRQRASHSVGMAALKRVSRIGTTPARPRVPSLHPPPQAAHLHADGGLAAAAPPEEQVRGLCTKEGGVPRRRWWEGCQAGAAQLRPQLAGGAPRPARAPALPPQLCLVCRRRAELAASGMGCICRQGAGGSTHQRA